MIITSMKENVVKYGSNQANSKGVIHHDPAAPASADRFTRHLAQIQ